MHDPRVLVVSFPSVMPVDQGIYVALQRRGWDLSLILPNRWVDTHAPDGHAIEPIEGFEGLFAKARIARPGNVQRHFYVTDINGWIERLRPDVAYVEAEYYGVPSLQWGLHLQRAGIPWGVQACEIQDRPLPWPAKVIRKWVLHNADFVTARSPAAADLALRFGARGEVGLLPHQLWISFAAPQRRRNERFTLGFVGRLVGQKGLDDLAAAVASLDFPIRLMIVGDGPMREFLERAPLGLGELDMRGTIPTEALPDLYAEMDALVLPSRTLPTTAERFGKVLIEAMACGTPVIGSSSGQIPWVIESTGGGLVFPEGDVERLAQSIELLATDESRRERLGMGGKEATGRLYTAEATAELLEGFLENACRARATDLEGSASAAPLSSARSVS